MQIPVRVRGHLAVVACAAVLAGGALRAQQPSTPDPNRWEPAIQKFEEADKLTPPVKGGIVFYGASSIVRWNLDESFPDLLSREN